MNTLPADKVVASFDSASVLHAGLNAALDGEPFPHLGHSAPTALSVRFAGRLPWPLLRRVYTRVGASEGLPPERLGDVDLDDVATGFADGVPERRYPAAFLGSSNGALTHLAAAMQVPWLPGTVLVPVARKADPHRPVDALDFGRRVAPALLERNPDIVLHHMHDQVQDELMVSQMTYFRTKWRRLPDAYADLLKRILEPQAPVILVEDRSPWPVVRVSDRHVFQTGAQGGVAPEEFLRRPDTPQPDDEAPEAEWGAERGFAESVETWCHANRHPFVRLTYQGPQAPAHAVATLFRDWYACRGEAADRLLVPSFIVGDPWTTINKAAVPFWTFFSVRAALASLDRHLSLSPPYREVHIMLFQHGVDSDGIATPDEWLRVAARHGTKGRLLGLNERRFPHDIASLGRYGGALADLSAARVPWMPMDVTSVLDSLGQDEALNVTDIPQEAEPSAVT